MNRYKTEANYGEDNVPVRQIIKRWIHIVASSKGSLREFSFKPWTFPIFLLLACIAAFGPFIPKLGFYWDDWPVILVAHQNGDFWEFFRFNRPFSAWVYVLAFPLLGTSPLNWHIFLLLLRWLTALGMWWALQQLWPQKISQISWVALVFAIYPAFTLQPISVAFSQHFITYALFFLSIGAMLTALRNQNLFWPLSLVALFSSGVHSLTMEYFWGLEIIRPLLIWILFQKKYAQFRTRLWQTLKLWTPYLLVLVGVVVWRMFFGLESDPNEPDLLRLILLAPSQGLVNLLNIGAKDFVQILFISWTKAIQTQWFDVQNLFLVVTWIFVIFFAVGINFYLSRFPNIRTGKSPNHSTWGKQALMMGIISFFIGMQPIWLLNRQTIAGFYSNRFALPAMFGSSLLLIGLLELLNPPRLQKTILLSVIVSLAIGIHWRNTNDFRWDWVEQRRFFWQLYWRAPGLKPGTAIFSDGEIFRFSGRTPTFTALNTLYPTPPKGNQQNYGFFELDEGPYQNIMNLEENAPISRKFRNLSFATSKEQSIVIFYEPNKGRCLWLLGEHDTKNPKIPELTRAALPLSNFLQIEIIPEISWSPDPRIFGVEPPHHWCYYFQKAELAWQQGNWQQIVNLHEEASRLDLTPGDSFEYDIFIEAYARTGNWETAASLTVRASKNDQRVRRTFCPLWNQLAEIPGSQEKDEAISRINERLMCVDA